MLGSRKAEAASYDIVAPYHDVLAIPYWSRLRPALRDALAPLSGLGGVVVDIGAGTGLSTQVVADTLPNAGILAIEPNSAMQAGLAARVAGNPDYARRVSIMPLDALSAPLPASIAGAVAISMIHHLGPHDRSELLSRLAACLQRDGLLVVQIQCAELKPVPEFRFEEAQLGEVTYSGSMSACLTGPQQLTWTASYRRSYQGRTLHEAKVKNTCWVVSADQIIQEAASVGLAGERKGELVLLRHRL